MGRGFGLIMLVVVVAVAGYLYTRQAQSVTSVGSNPQTTVDVTAVRNDLIAIANAERNYFASNGKYASLDELRTSGDLTIRTRPNYSYSAQTTDSTFKIIAVYSGPDPKAPKRITVDETMAVTME
jgi:Tfp pilus assembly protein PilE